MLQDKESRNQRKQLRDRNKETAHRNTTIGDKFLIKLQKRITKPAFDPKPCTYIKVNGTQVTAVKGTETRVRKLIQF